MTREDLPEYAEKQYELGNEVADFINSYIADDDHKFTSMEIIGAIEHVKLAFYAQVEEAREVSDSDFRIGGSLE